MDIDPYLGDKLRATREGLEISLDEVAGSAGLNRVTLYRLETSKGRKLQPDTARRYIEAYVHAAHMQVIEHEAMLQTARDSLDYLRGLLKAGQWAEPEPVAPPAKLDLHGWIGLAKNDQGGVDHAVDRRGDRQLTACGQRVEVDPTTPIDPDDPITLDQLLFDLLDTDEISCPACRKALGWPE